MLEGAREDMDPDAVALGTLEALQGEINATIDGLKAKYLVNARVVPVEPAQWAEDAASGGKRCLPAADAPPAPGADLYANPGFEEAVRMAVGLARHLKQYKLEDIVVNGLGFVEPAVEAAVAAARAEVVDAALHLMGLSPVVPVLAP
ncbi:MAG: hypothetical protein Q7S17_07670 [Xanthobacteraceae bacterium]|nr:hypothetical protein [Xanthobacteraceae bacterium]